MGFDLFFGVGEGGLGILSLKLFISYVPKSDHGKFIRLKTEAHYHIMTINSAPTLDCSRSSFSDLYQICNRLTNFYYSAQGQKSTPNATVNPKCNTHIPRRHMSELNFTS